MLSLARPESIRTALALCAAALALTPSIARAGGLRGHDLGPFGASALPTTKNPCAAYGAGFEAVGGGSTCVKIGGRVHVESSFGASDWRVAPAAGAAARAAAPGLDAGAGPGAPSHLRLQRRY